MRYTPILALAICMLANSAIAAPPSDVNAKKIALLKKIYKSDIKYRDADDPQYTVEEYGTPALKNLLYKVQQKHAGSGDMPPYMHFVEAFYGTSDPSALDPKSVKYTVLKNGNIQVRSRTLPLYYYENGKKSKVVAVKPYTTPTVHYKVVCGKSCLIDDIILPSGNPKYPDWSFKEAIKDDLNGKQPY